MLSAKHNGDAPTVLSVVTLLIGVYTLYTTFLIYGQRMHGGRDMMDIAASRCPSPAGVGACSRPDSLRSYANNCLADNQSDFAVIYLKTALECNKTDLSAYSRLSHVYVHILGTSALAVELLQPHYANSNVSQAVPFLRQPELTCTYMQALVGDQATTRAVLQLVERLQQEGIVLDACMLSVHTEALYELKYYVDAYQVAMDFVQKHPELPSSHAWMGQTLSALRRNEEATVVLHVARSLVREDERWNADLPLLKRLGDAFYYVNASEAAADMYARVLPAMQSSAVLRDQRCEVLLRQGKLYLELNSTHSAYVTLLQSARDCPGNPLTTLYLGMAQHQVGLFHHASDTLKLALKHKSTKVEARAALKALKAAREAIMAEQVRLAEEALGPKPPVDPTIERHQQNESYIDYMARVRKQQEEQENAEWERARRAKEQAAASSDAATEPPVAANPVETGTAPSSVTDRVTMAESSGASIPAAEEISTPPESRDSVDSTRTTNGDISVDNASASTLSEDEAAARNVADQFVIMAAAYVKKEDYAQALKQLNKAVKRAPAYAAPYLQRGQVHLAMGSTALAVADLLKVVTELDKADSTASSLLLRIATELALAGKHSEAEAILQPLNAELPTDETFCLSQATVYVRQGDLQGAIRSLQRMGDAVLAASPQAQRLLAQLGAISAEKASESVATMAAEDARLNDEPAAAGAAGGAALHRRSRWVRHAGDHATDDAAAPTSEGSAASVDQELHHAE